MLDPTATATGRIRRAGWVRVTYGAHRRDDVDSAWLTELAAWQSVLPRCTAFTHLTGARLWGLWLPPLPDDLPVWVQAPEKRSASCRTGLVVTRHLKPAPVATVQELRVAIIVEVLLACARDLCLLDLVVLVDAALHLKLGTLGELMAHAKGRRRGGPRLREAISLADGRSESAYETLLRVLHVVCGIQVEPQHEFEDGDGTARSADLWLVGTDRFHEYDGADHLTRKRQRKDLKRSAALDRAGHRRRGFTKEDVLHQAIVILREADEALGRPTSRAGSAHGTPCYATRCSRPPGQQRSGSGSGLTTIREPGFSPRRTPAGGRRSGSRSR